MKVSMNVECFCGSTNKIIFKKPSHFVPTIEKHVCVDCESEILYKFKKLNGLHKVSIEKAIVKPSDTLRLIMMEERSEEETKVAT